MPSPRTRTTVPSKRLTAPHMTATAGCKRSIACSGSRPATSSVEPTTSANITVACFRSPSAIAKGAPQELQNRAFGGFSWRQREHAAIKRPPQPPQNAWLAGLSVLQLGQRIKTPEICRFGIILAGFVAHLNRATERVVGGPIERPVSVPRCRLSARVGGHHDRTLAAQKGPTVLRPMGLRRILRDQFAVNVPDPRRIRPVARANGVRLARGTWKHMPTFVYGGRRLAHARAADCRIPPPVSTCDFNNQTLFVGRLVGPEALTIASRASDN